MTAFKVDMRSDQEKEAVYNQLPREVLDGLPILIDMNFKVGRQKYHSLSSKEKERVQHVSYDYLDFSSNWEQWEKRRQDFPMTLYRLVKRPDIKEPCCPWIFFVNIRTTEKVLSENHALFEEVVGFEFDPNVLDELEDGESLFWTRVMSDDRAWGTILGFGTENARCYYQKYTKKEEPEHPGSPSEPQYQTFKIRAIEDPPIPGFISFAQNDPVILKYLEEKKAIQAVYKNKDFVRVSLDQLLRDPS